ncbi:hypothetical protein B7P43_G01906, partial [Cryptotermes secundus]
ENLETEVDVNKAWETIRENIILSAKERLGYYEPKKHKARFDEGCSKLLDQRKQAKFQWLQDPRELNGDNLHNIRRETSRHFRNKKREYLKDKIDELAMNSKNKTIDSAFRRQTQHPCGSSPYSPDMAPCDFWLFPKPKMPLKGTRFKSREDIMRNSATRLITIPKDAFQKCFQQWRKRWEKCVHYQGDYFEGN